MYVMNKTNKKIEVVAPSFSGRRTFWVYVTTRINPRKNREDSSSRVCEAWLI